jgi:hypothetical protein
LQWKMLVYFTSIWLMFRPFGRFYSHLVYYPRLGTFFPVLSCCTKKNLATLAAVTLVDISIFRSAKRSRINYPESNWIAPFDLNVSRAFLLLRREKNVFWFVRLWVASN